MNFGILLSILSILKFIPRLLQSYPKTAMMISFCSRWHARVQDAFFDNNKTMKSLDGVEGSLRAFRGSYRHSVEIAVQSQPFLSLHLEQSESPHRLISGRQFSSSNISIDNSKYPDLYLISVLGRTT